MNEQVSVARDPDAPESFSLKRWSRRKLDSARAAPRAAPPAAAPAGAPATAPVGAPAAVSTPTAARSPGQPAESAPEATLPNLDTLNFDSDLTAFFRPKVEEDTKRAALKKLLSDPRFNVMDGLDTYIDDYSKPDPMPAGMLDRLANIYQQVAEAVDPGKADTAAVLPSSRDAVDQPAATTAEAGNEDAATPEPAPAALVEPEAGVDAAGLPVRQAEAAEAVPPPPQTGKPS